MAEFLAVMMVLTLVLALAAGPGPDDESGKGGPPSPVPTPPAPKSGDQLPVPPTPPEPFKPLDKFKTAEDQAQAYVESEQRLGVVQNEVGQLRQILTEVLSRTGQVASAAPTTPEVSPEEEQAERVKPLAKMLERYEQGEASAEEVARLLDEGQQRQILAAVETAVTPLLQSYNQDVGPSAIEREAGAQFEAMKKANPKLAALDSRQIAAAVAQRANIGQWRGVPAETRQEFIEDVAYLELGRAVAATGKLPGIQGGPPALEPEPVGGGRTGAGGALVERETQIAHIIETSGGLLVREQAEAIADGKEMPLMSEIKR